MPLQSQAIATFRLTLAQHLELAASVRSWKRAHELLQDQLDYQILRSVPGVGPIIALNVLAEAGDLRRFGHERQFLKFCGLDLATFTIGRLPRPHSIIEAWQQQITLSSVDGSTTRYAYAGKHLQAKVQSLPAIGSN